MKTGQRVKGRGAGGEEEELVIRLVSIRFVAFLVVVWFIFAFCVYIYCC